VDLRLDRSGHHRSEHPCAIAHQIAGTARLANVPPHYRWDDRSLDQPRLLAMGPPPLFERQLVNGTFHFERQKPLWNRSETACAKNELPLVKPPLIPDERET